MIVIYLLFRHAEVGILHTILEIILRSILCVNNTIQPKFN